MPDAKLFLGAPARRRRRRVQHSLEQKIVSAEKFCGLKRVAPAAATRPFDQWCEIKSFTPLQLIAIASRAALEKKRKKEERVSTSAFGAGRVSFSILPRITGQKQQLSRVLRAPQTHTAPFHQRDTTRSRHRIMSLYSQPDTFSAALNLLDRLLCRRIASQICTL